VGVREGKVFWWFGDGIVRKVVVGLDKEKAKSIVKV